MGGNICTSQIPADEIGQLQPIVTSFTLISTEVKLRSDYENIFNEIQKRFDIIDSRKNRKLNWYESDKFNLYLYGFVLRDKPIGDCFFCVKDPSIKQTPIIIATKINEHYVFSDKTLILYFDKSFYYGNIKNSVATLPRAEGLGILVSPDFIYEGEFNKGLPHGFGKYRTKYLEFVGIFRNGEPFGQGIEKTGKGLFIGQNLEKGARKGYLINKQNEKRKVDDLNSSRIAIKSHLGD